VTEGANTTREWLIGVQDAVFNRADLDAYDRCFAPGYVRHAEDHDYTRDEYREVIAALHQAFPDLQTEFGEVVSEPPRVGFRWVSRGTHAAAYFGVPPTQRAISASGITISRISNGLITEEWASWNKLSLLHALGIVPITRQ
jgi:steroid delta-isomerase-like uncharacterized protein